MNFCRFGVNALPNELFKSKKLLKYTQKGVERKNVMYKTYSNLVI